MGADGNITPKGGTTPVELSGSGNGSSMMPIIVPESTGAISPLATSNIAKPDAGTIRVIDVGNTPELHFNFDALDVKMTALDVDLVMIFSDNSKLILPNLAMDLVSTNPPKLFFRGSLTSPQSVIAAISNVDLVSATPSVHLASPDYLPKKKGGNTEKQDVSTTGHDGVGGGEPPVPPVPVASGAKGSRSGGDEHSKTADFAAPPAPVVQPGTLAVSQGETAISNPSVIPVGKAQSDNSGTAITFDVPVIAKMYQIVEPNPIKSVIGPTTNIMGGSGTSPADIDSSFAAQNAIETIHGTAGNDEIWADNKAYSAGGMAGRVISLLPANATAYTLTSLTVSGLPAGFTILDGTLVGADAAGNLTYTINPHAKASNEFQFQLAYTLPEAPNLTKDHIKLAFTGIKTGTTELVTLNSTAYLAITDVIDDAQQITINPTDGVTVINLSLHPTGNCIMAGDGDDSIHAAAGADSIDGGGGNNWVEYDLSKYGVSVNLKTGVGNGGFATGDTYTNIHNIVGSTAADTLVGDDAGDTIKGGGGHDSILGGAGNDFFTSDGTGNTIDGGGGTLNEISYASSSTAVIVDIGAGKVSGGNSFDIIRNITKITGSSFGDDVMISGTSATWLDAGKGNDTVESGIDGDTLDGGEGIDMLSYVNSTAGVTVNLSTHAAAGGFAAGDLFQNFENLTGSDYNDCLLGDSHDNVIIGGKGDDWLDGGGGNDTLMGGDGNDTLIAGSGTNSIAGGAGDDLIVASSGVSSIDGGDGVDTVDYSNAVDGLYLKLTDAGQGFATAAIGGFSHLDIIQNVENIIGGQYNDTLVGNQSANSINGGAGDDCLSGGLGNDTLDGGTGRDTVDYSYLSASTTQSIILSADGQTFNATAGSNDADVLYNFEVFKLGKGTNIVDLSTSTASTGFVVDGSAGQSNSIVGSMASDSLLGGSHNDTFAPGGGRDTIDGGDGIDTVDFSQTFAGGVKAVNTAPVTINLGAFGPGAGIGYSGDARDTKFFNIENIIGTSGADSLTGDSNNNMLSGGAGNDTLDGGDGNDTLIGGTGGDLLLGGSGNDLLDSRGGGGSSLSGGLGDDTLLGGDSNDTFSGGPGNDSIIGGSGTADLIDFAYASQAGESVSITGSGTTFTVSGLVNGSVVETDTLVNIEVLHLTQYADTVLLSNATSDLSIIGQGGADSIIAGSGNDTIIASASSADVSLAGSEGNNSIIGGSGDDTITAGAGNDIIIGGAGNDVISAGAGNNSIIGQGGADSIIAGSGNDTITASASSAGVLIAGGDGNNSIIGGSGDDTITAGVGNDIIIGGAGNDVISAGYGTNSIDGGNGTADTVDYSFLNGAGSISIAATGATAFSAVGPGVSDTLANVEYFVGTSGNDTMDMHLATSDLSLSGSAGADSFIGGTGHDTIDGGTDRDAVSYADLDGTANGVTLTMGADAATFSAVITPGDRDTLINIETLALTSHADSVNLSSASANLSISGRGGADTIIGGLGSDTIDASASASTAAVVLTDLSGNNLMIGGAGNDTITTGSGNDTIIGNLGNDVIDAGSGMDTVAYSYLTDPNKTFTLTRNSDTNWTAIEQVGAATYTQTLINVEAIVLGAGHNTVNLGLINPIGLTIDGSAQGAVDSIITGAGNDCIVGGAGNDTFDSGTGLDTMQGGAGSDLYYVRNANDKIIESADVGSVDEVRSYANRFNLSTNGQSVEILTFVGSGAFTGVGNDTDNLITGGSSDDSLVGGGGNDTFVWTGGNDSIDGEGLATANSGTNDLVDFSAAQSIQAIQNSGDKSWSVTLTDSLGNVFTESLANIEALIGGTGNDTVSVGEFSTNLTLDGKGGTANTLDYSTLSSATSVSVTLNGANITSVVLAGNASATDTVVNFENVYGGAGADTLIGDQSDNLFRGYGGQDSIDGVLNTNGSNHNTADYSYVTTSDGLTVSLNLSTAATATVNADDTDTLRNIQNIIGTRNDDCIAGDTANNSLSGGAGNDTLSGGGGNDTLDGGFVGGVIGNEVNAVDFTYIDKNQTSSFHTHSIGALNDLQWTATLSGGGDNVLMSNFNSIILGHGYNTVDLSSITHAVTIDGSRGQADSIATGAGADSLLGGAGNDLFSGGAGNDTMDGGGGINNIADYSYLNNSTSEAGAGLSLVLDASGNGTANVQTITAVANGTDPNTGATVYINSLGTLLETDTLRNIRHIIGTSNNDCLIGQTGSETLDGGAGGRDSFYGLGSDVLDGRKGVGDYFNGGDDHAAHVTMIGNAGNDTFFANSASDSIVGGGGNDAIQTNAFTSIDLKTPGSMFQGFAVVQYTGSSAFTGIGDGKSNTIVGSSGNDYLQGGGGDDCLVGLGGDNTFYGTSGSDDTMSGGTGNDVYHLLSANGSIIDTGGINSLYTSLATIDLSDSKKWHGFRNVAYEGTPQSFYVIGSVDDNVISGSSANDCLNGGDGNDTIIGNGNNDTSTGNNDTLIGGAGSDSIIASGNGNNILYDGTGSETGETGYSDTLIGGNGTNIFFVSGVNDSVQGGTGLDTIYTPLNSISLNTANTSNIENLLHGNKSGGALGGNFTGIGNSLYNVITGGTGANSLYGDGGNDTLIGNSSNDTLSGGTGNDSLWGDGGFNVASYFYVGTNLSLSLTNTATQTLYISTSSVAGQSDIDLLANIQGLIGGSGNDTLTGTSSSAGYSGANYLGGGDGNDILYGNANSTVGTAGDTLDGGTGNDSLYGTSGQADSLFGGSGDDYLSKMLTTTIVTSAIGKPTAYDGGDGFDTVDYSYLSNTANKLIVTATSTSIGTTFTVSVMNGSALAELDTLTNIEATIGTKNNDSIDLSGANTTVNLSLTGNGGADSLIGSGGNDTLTAYSAQNTMGASSLSGGAGNDSLMGGSANDTLSGGTGNDSLDGGAGTGDIADYTYSNGGLLKISDTQSLSGGGSAFSVTVGNNADDIDLLVNMEGIRFAGTGNYTVDGSLASFALNIDGSSGSGNDSILGGSGNDTLRGGSGNDSIQGGFGTNLIYGGSGTNLIDYSYIQSGHTLNLTRGSADTVWLDSVDSSVYNDTLYSITQVKLGSGSNTVNLSTMTTAVTIDGSPSANDCISTGSGNDSIIGGSGSNTISGGNGINTIDGSLGYIDSFVGGTGNDSIIGGSGSNTISGGSGNNTIDGSHGTADSLVGGTGSDSILGGGNADSISDGGGTGADTLIGGSGNDIYYIGSANDQIVEYADANSIDTVITSLTTYSLASTATLYNGVQSGYIENLTYSGTQAFSGTGNELDNVITGGSGADTLVGGAGNDTLIGGSGNDLLSGGAGNDWLDGGLGTNTADYSYINANQGSPYSAGINVVLSAGSATVTAVAGSDVDQLFNIQNITGTDFNDTLVGDSNANILKGGLGADSLVGGLGNDTLNGGGDFTTNAAGNTVYLDWVDYTYSTTGIVAVLSGTGGTVTAQAGIDVDTLQYIENVMGSTLADSMVGDQMNNYFKGGLGADTLSGGAGNDTLDGNGSGQNDTSGVIDMASYAYLTSSTSSVSIVLNNGAGTAVVSATDTDNLINIEGIIGGAGNDTMGGDVNANSLFGGNGNDSFIGSLGYDSLDGGNGTDSADYSALALSGYYETVSGTGYNLTITKYNAAGVPVSADTLTNIEYITGLAFAPANSTMGFNANLQGLAVNFAVVGTSYADTLIGGSGNDTFQGGAGNDSFDGGGGYNIADYSYTKANLLITFNNPSLPSTVTVNGTTDVDTLINVQGIIAGGGNDTITNPALYGAYGTYFTSLSINAGAGNDVIVAGYGSNQTIDGGSGTDTFDASKITTYGVYVDMTQNKWGGYRAYLYDQGQGLSKIYNVENIIGTGSDDSIIGDSNNNYIFGGAGNETIVGGLGSDTLDGGAGNDIVSFAYMTNTSPGLSINLNSTTVVAGVTYQFLTVNNGGSIDQIMNFEGVFGGGGNDTLIGTSGPNTFSGGAGTNSIDGGNGQDIVDYSWIAAGSNFAITTSGTTWNVTVTDSGGNTVALDTLVNMEGFNFGNINLPTSINLANASVALNFSGSAGNDTFIAGSGNDSVSVGYGGNDTLDGGAGNDSLSLAGLSGAIYGIETVIMNGQSGTMTGSLANSTVNFTNFEYITLDNADSGGAGTGIGDKFVGSVTTSNVYVYGWGGADTLDDGGGKNMTLDGQTDNDVYFIRSSTTQINENITYGYGNINSVNTTLTSIDLSSSQYGSGSMIANLTYLDARSSIYDTSSGTWSTNTLGSGNFTGLGNDMNNSITGGYGNNSIVGGAGADTLLGNNGNDYLRGGDLATGSDSLMNKSSSWSYGGVSVGLTTTAPDGTNTAFLLGADSSSGQHYTYGSGLNSSLGPSYQLTAYVKAYTNGSGTGRYVEFAFNNSSNNKNFAADSWIGIDLLNGGNASGTLGPTFTANGPVYAGGTGGGTYNVVYDAATGWYKVSLTALLTGGNTGTYEIVPLTSKMTTFLPSFTGDGTSILMWNRTLTAVDGADSLYGGGGNDTLQGGNGNDSMDGGGTSAGGIDVADYSYVTTGVTLNLASFDTTTYHSVSISAFDIDQVRNFEGLIGGAGSDSLLGDSAANSLGGGMGSDTIDGGGGNDTLDGGAGNDMLSFASATSGVFVSLANSSMSGGGHNDTYYNFEGLIGSHYADTLVGTSASESFDGGSTIASDSIYGGGGNDWLAYGSLNGGVGVIVTLGTYTNTTLATGGGGTDTLNGTFTGVIGSQYSDTLIGSAAAVSETFDGGAGTAGDSIYGNGGNDWLAYGSLNGGIGVSVTLGTYSNFALATVGAGTDTLTGTFRGVIGSQYSDGLVGTVANETFDGGAGAVSDTIVGGGGSDWLSYGSLIGGQGVTLTLGDYSTQSLLLYTGGGGNDSVSGVFQGAIGSIYADSILGSTLNDTIFGGAGNDTIDSGRGSNESLDGGDGFDFLSFTSANGAINVSLGNQSMSGGGYTALNYTNFEGIIGSGYNDQLKGDGNANYIYGNNGNDTILGYLGADTIQGGVGNDSLDGNGSGNADSPSTVDVVDYSYTSASLTVALNGSQGTISVTVASGSDTDTIQNFEGIIGGSGADSFTGDSLNNYLSGGAGNDTLDATVGGGNDTLLGGTGNDLLKLDWSSLNLSNLDGGAGNDTVSFSGNGNVSLSFTASSFNGILTNVEQLDFSSAGGQATLTMDGAGIQKILGGTASTSAFAGVLDVKLDPNHESLILAANSNYTYWSSSSPTSAASLSGTVNLSGLSTTGADIYVFDSTHTTLLADLHYHT